MHTYSAILFSVRRLNPHRMTAKCTNVSHLTSVKKKRNSHHRRLLATYLKAANLHARPALTNKKIQTRGIWWEETGETIKLREYEGKKLGKFRFFSSSLSKCDCDNCRKAPRPFADAPTKKHQRALVRAVRSKYRNAIYGPTENSVCQSVCGRRAGNCQTACARSSVNFFPTRCDISSTQEIKILVCLQASFSFPLLLRLSIRLSVCLILNPSVAQLRVYER